MIKRLARWILRREIQQDEKFVNRLRGYCVEYGCSARLEADPNGADQTYEFQRAFDVFGGVELAAGTFRTNSVIRLPNKNPVDDDDQQG